MLTTIVQTLAQLHSQDAAAVGLAGFGKPSGFYERQIRTMARTTKAQVEMGRGKVVPIPRVDELLAWFAEHMPEDRNTIVYNDFDINLGPFSRDSQPHLTPTHTMCCTLLRTYTDRVRIGVWNPML